MNRTPRTTKTDQGRGTSRVGYPSRRGRITQLPRRSRREAIDWERVESLYSFVRDRSLERLQDAEQRGDGETMAEERRQVQAVDAMFTQARQGHAVVVACAITFFRARAMRDAHHEDFLGEWLGTTNLQHRSAS